MRKSELLELIFKRPVLRRLILEGMDDFQKIDSVRAEIDNLRSLERRGLVEVDVEEGLHKKTRWYRLTESGEDLKKHLSDFKKKVGAIEDNPKT